ncbi:hypothetical protein CROQUDRAFT_655233 [Cronartium quercuum f. sp. fusiforme G11]|uniref:Uncharacterized protein n=1 Tax=Cronartium quercuum f. sp. fusiforme G11 TaxID=708437 RepID=A0A9P6NJD6_9BASI|nr:hypothetical protein CROQUDRAFT_655233 [Cronartium quercuum f. sp. fusiforme G11]
MDVQNPIPQTVTQEPNAGGVEPNESLNAPILSPSNSSSPYVRTSLSPPPRHPRSYIPATLHSLNQSHVMMPSSELDHLATEQNAWSGRQPTVAATRGPLPSIIFAIPFPEPASHVHRTAKTPAFMLYSFPRANYEKPLVGSDGKRGKEGLIKKVERKWQEEVKQGDDIKKGKLQEPSVWQKFKGGATRIATKVIKWLPDSNIETLGRLPPGKKIGYVTIVYPHEIDEVINDAPARTPEEIKKGLDEILNRTRKSAVMKTTISAFLLPVTAAIDFFCIVPLFLFEINIVYFSLQVNGARKVGTLARANNRGNKPVKAHKKKRSLKSRFKRRRGKVALQEPNAGVSVGEAADEEVNEMQTAGQDHENANVNIFNVQKSRPHVFQPILAHLYSVCSQLDRSTFPANPQSDVYQTPSYIPTSAMVSELVRAFREWVPADVALRHNLDEKVVAEDLGRCLKKASKEYIRTLKGRTGQKFSI